MPRPGFYEDGTPHEYHLPYLEASGGQVRDVPARLMTMQEAASSRATRSETRDRMADTPLFLAGSLGPSWKDPPGAIVRRSVSVSLGPPPSPRTQARQLELYGAKMAVTTDKLKLDMQINLHKQCGTALPSIEEVMAQTDVHGRNFAQWKQLQWQEDFPDQGTDNNTFRSYIKAELARWSEERLPKMLALERLRTAASARAVSNPCEPLPGADIAPSAGRDEERV
jgi:hypothetical protein